MSRSAVSQAVATSAVVVEEVLDVSSPEHLNEAALGGRFEGPRSASRVLQEAHSVFLEAHEALPELEGLDTPGTWTWSADGFKLTPLTVKPWLAFCLLESLASCAC